MSKATQDEAVHIDEPYGPSMPNTLKGHIHTTSATFQGTRCEKEKFKLQAIVGTRLQSDADVATSTSRTSPSRLTSSYLRSSTTNASLTDHSSMDNARLETPLRCLAAAAAAAPRCFVHNRRSTGNAITDTAIQSPAQAFARASLSRDCPPEFWNDFVGVDEEVTVAAAILVAISASDVEMDDFSRHAAEQ